jgi:hypothetical protein
MRSFLARETRDSREKNSFANFLRGLLDKTEARSKIACLWFALYLERSETNRVAFHRNCGVVGVGGVAA